VRVDLDEVRRGLGLPGVTDRESWEQIRRLLADAVDESTFALWFEKLELIAIDGSVAAPATTRSWVRERFGRLMDGCAERTGRQLRIADEPEQLALGRNDGCRAEDVGSLSINQKEAAG
jgi:hypothetical protein